eukprot:Skav203442  [mRNA]  locus=scaffold1836:312750:323052:- [translate_table: standard]
MSPLCRGFLAAQSYSAVEKLRPVPPKVAAMSRHGTMSRALVLVFGMALLRSFLRSETFVGQSAPGAQPQCRISIARSASEGDALPSIAVDEGKPGEEVNVAELFKGKKGVLFAVPGAFTPTCSEKHLPGYIEKAEELKDAGAEVVACVSVNDAFVMKAWGQQQKAPARARRGDHGGPL